MQDKHVSASRDGMSWLGSWRGDVEQSWLIAVLGLLVVAIVLEVAVAFDACCLAFVLGCCRRASTCSSPEASLVRAAMSGVSGGLIGSAGLGVDMCSATLLSGRARLLMMWRVERSCLRVLLCDLVVYGVGLQVTSVANVSRAMCSASVILSRIVSA